jgi:hypothetical protein
MDDESKPDRLQSPNVAFGLKLSGKALRSVTYGQLEAQWFRPVPRVRIPLAPPHSLNRRENPPNSYQDLRKSPQFCAGLFCHVALTSQESSRGVSSPLPGATLDGRALADGDLIQVVHGDWVTCRITFFFKDGSVHDETAIFSQRDRFRLLSDHLFQKGPTFEHPLDISLDALTGDVTVRYT